MTAGTLDITAARFSFGSPLAKALFAVDGVTRVFYGKDYISVGKQDEVEWNDLKPQIYEKIEQFYASGEPLFMEKQAPSGNDVKDTDSETVAFIKEILETRIRPTVQNDGGDIEFVDFEEETGEVSLTLKGSCTNCPSSSRHSVNLSRCDTQERYRANACLLRG